MLYSMAWRASHGIMVWPGGPGMGYGRLCGHRMVKYGLVGITWYMIWSGGHHMEYGYGLAGNARGLA